MRFAENLLNGVKVLLPVVVAVCFFASAAYGQYCSASGGCTGTGGTLNIDSVQVGSINNTGTGCSGYADYTSLSTTMEIGTGYTITVTNGDPYDEDDQCGIWVDWNADDDFDDADETISVSGGNVVFTGTITPPDTAALGATRMRVRIRWGGTLEPCGDTTYGEVEDYTIVVEEKLYEIWTAADMQAIGADTYYWDKHFQLMADIDLSAYTGTSFNIIGTGSTKFTGVFDGNSHTIANFTYDSNGTKRIGLFAYVDGPSAGIKNLGLIEPNVDAGTGSYVGSLVGLIEEGSITNCYVEGGGVSGDECVGGLIGISAYGTVVSDCYVDDTSVSGSGYFVGGLVGLNGGSLSGSHSTGSVSGDQYIGGLAGYNPGEIDQCYSASDVIGNKFTGGLVGNNGGDMGIGSIANSYSTGRISGVNRTGGLVGYNCKGSIVNCCSTGSVSGNVFVGGLVGQNYFGSVSRSYSAGSLDGNSYVGGLAGAGSACNYTKCFWDVNVNPDVNGISNADDPNVIGKTTAQMHRQSTFTDAGWDFTTPIWKMNCEKMSYPKLSWWQPVLGDFGCPDGVEMRDFAVLAAQWRLEELSADVAPDGGDGFVNFLDWAPFAEKWQILLTSG